MIMVSLLCGWGPQRAGPPAVAYVAQKNWFRIICVIMSGLIVSGTKKRGVLAEGVPAESSVTSKKMKNYTMFWVRQYIWHS